MSDGASDTTVYIVDDDEAVRHGLKMLLQSAGHGVEEFASANDFLEGFAPAGPACLILDLRMPVTSGLELQEELGRRNLDVPIIFLTGHGNVPSAVRALKGGAVDFMQKPVEDEQALLDRVSEAIRRHAVLRQEATQREDAAAMVERLTPREREVIELVCDGKANKVIAADLEISERTVELHRGRAMKKMGARSVAELIRMLDTQRQQWKT